MPRGRQTSCVSLPSIQLSARNFLLGERLKQPPLVRGRNPCTGIADPKLDALGSHEKRKSKTINSLVDASDGCSTAPRRCVEKKFRSNLSFEAELVASRSVAGVRFFIRCVGHHRRSGTLDADAIFFVHAERGDLFTVIERLQLTRARLPMPVLRSVAFQSLRALEELQSSGYAHMDIKAGNTFIRRSGDLVLGDLGGILLADAACFYQGWY